MLNDLIGRVEQTQLTEKDPEAEQLLNQRLGRNPNALYVLAQTVLVQKYALEQAQAQLAQLRQLQQTQPAQQPARATSFLGGLFGHHDPAASPAASPTSTGVWGVALCPALEPGSRVRTSASTPGWWLKLSPHRRDHGSWSRCRGAGLSGGRVVAARLRWRPGRSGRRRILWRRRCRERPSSTIIMTMPEASMSASPIAALGIAATTPRTCSRPVTACETTGIIRTI